MTSKEPTNQFGSCFQISSLKDIRFAIHLRKLFPIIFLIQVILIQACSPTESSLTLFEPTNIPEPIPTIEIDPLSTITFQVEVPEGTPTDQPILFSTLDEVTGLALNINRQEMQKTGPGTYSITLPFPVGANIKYRYARQDLHTAEEHTSDGRPVRYRLYRNDGPGVVHDVISAWSDSTFSGSTGRIMGKVIDVKSDLPVPNLLVTAGGAQSVTASNGDFLLEGLPPGVHNLVAYAFDGSFQTFQQGAVVAKDSTTPAEIQVKPAPLVKLIFSVEVPEGTLPAVPIRLAGNLSQLGNTFADLSGGINTLASRMPILTPLPNGRYALEIELPSGAYLVYKYTLGDGFWNTEHTSSGNFHLRTMTVPESDTLVEDRIDNWGSSSKAGPIIFDLNVPSSTPELDFVSIQFNPFDWTEPIPMWDLGDDHWVYMLFSPITNQDEIAYRYCRNDQCGRADDVETPGTNTPGRVLKISGGTQTAEDSVDEWFWLFPELSADLEGIQKIPPRSAEFIAGVELQPYYHPSWTPRFPVTGSEIESLQANWLFLSPTWTFTRQNPPVLEPVIGKDASWQDLSFMTDKTQAYGLQVALIPSPIFPTTIEEWWLESPGDFPWWQAWFERYENFILSFADKAQIDGVNGLVMGGDWVSPALPGGVFPDGSPSGVPADAESRWRNLIAEVRNRFDGTLFWALPAAGEGIQPPSFIEELDHVYLLWSLPLTDQPEANLEKLTESAGNYLDREVFPLEVTLEMPFTIAVAYPSAKGSLQGCIPVTKDEGLLSCLDPGNLEPGQLDFSEVEHEFNEQLSAYQALFAAISERDWIDGFVSRGYYPPAELHDKSTSIHGKPAQDIVSDWFSHLTGTKPEE